MAVNVEMVNKILSETKAAVAAGRMNAGQVAAAEQTMQRVVRGGKPVSGRMGTLDPETAAEAARQLGVFHNSLFR